MIQLYTFSSCTSCRKARDILTGNQIPFIEQNMNTEPLSREQIMNILTYTTNGTSEIMSKRSQEVKSLDLNVEDLSVTEWIDLVQKHPGILRRPILVTNEQLVVGYNKEEYEGIIKKYQPHQKELQTAVSS